MASRREPGGIAGWPKRGLRTPRHDSTHGHQPREHFRTSWLECSYPKHYQLVSVLLALHIMSIALLTHGNRTHIQSRVCRLTFWENAIPRHQSANGYALTVSGRFLMTWPCACQSGRTMQRLGDPSGAGNLGALTKSKSVHASVRGERQIMKLFRDLGEQASESQLGLALIVAAVTMGLMLCAIVWQSSVIGLQRDVIQWMWSVKYGG
jgi:hypothetical protein